MNGEPMTAAEVASLNAILANRLRKDRIARPAKPPAETPRRRRPLGLRPVGDDVVHEAPASEAGFEDPTVALVADISALLVQLIEDQRRHFESKLADLGNTIGALKNENQNLRLILENLRITQRGERGVDGDRGPPGRDGRDGEGRIGPRGERGERGLPAPTIAAWAIDAERFVATPILSNGNTGAALHLQSLFETYDEQVDASDAAE